MGLYQTYNITINIQLYMSGAQMQQGRHSQTMKCQSVNTPSIKTST